MIKILDDTENDIVNVVFDGQIGLKDYEISGPIIEKVIKARKPVRLLLDWTSFSGWSEESESQAFFFRTGHQGDFERVAIIGEHKWRSVATEFDAILDAEVRFFDTRDAGEAMRWLRDTCGPL